MKKKCKDDRCLYLVKDAEQKECNFSTLTKITREGPGLWEKCNICGLAINRSGVQKKEAEKFYNQTYQEKNSLEANKTLTAKAHFEARKDSVKKIFNKLKPYLKSSMKVYELGAGAGELLFYLKNKVKYCEGNEINKVYSDFINNKLKIKCNYSNFMDQKFNDPFDLIISICTIDHIYETRPVVEKIYRSLKKGGLFYLELPNDHQILNKYLKPAFSNSFSKFMYQKAHYYSFTFVTISALLKNVGFKIQTKETRQEYTYKNFLNWYFVQKPQISFDEATSDSKLLNNFKDKLEGNINRLFDHSEKKFNKIVKNYGAGDTICVLAKK